MSTPITTINSNTVNLAQYRGTITRCPMCNIGTTMQGRSCKLCFDRKFVARCLRCNGTGLQTQGSIWDGGRTEHRSTCGACGGSGYFPVNRPKDWKDEIATTTVSTATPNTAITSTATASNTATNIR